MSDFGPSDVAAVLQGLGSLGSGVAIVFASFVASSAWKREKIGSRRIDNAERILNAALQAEQALWNIRSKFIWDHQLHAALHKLGLEYDDNEFEDFYRVIARAEVVLERLEENNHAVDELMKCYAISLAIFGNDTRKALTDLASSFEAVEVAAKVLVSSVHQEFPDNTILLCRSAIDSRFAHKGNNRQNDIAKASVEKIKIDCLPLLNS